MNSFGDELVAIMNTRARGDKKQEARHREVSVARQCGHSALGTESSFTGVTVTTPGFSWWTELIVIGGARTVFFCR